MAENILNSSENIVKRLEELRTWQMEQQQILISRQFDQKKMLEIEQQKMYESLGLSPNNRRDHVTEEISKQKPTEIWSAATFKSSELLENGNSYLDEGKNEKNNALPFVNNDESNLPKRPFLKRGQGLKARFKIDPNAFRLDNLPRYNYAGVHKNISQKLPKPKVLQKNETRLKQTDKNRLSLEKEETSMKKLIPEPTEYCKTLPPEPTMQKKHLEGLDFSILDSIDKKPNLLTGFKSMEKDTKSTSWKKILDTNNIEPILVESFRSVDDSGPNNESDNLSIFELLERKAEGSFELDASNIKKWIQEKAKALLDESDALDEIRTDHMRKSKIQPFPFDVDEKLIPDESDSIITTSESETDEEPAAGKAVRFSDHIKINEAESETETVQSSDIEATDLKSSTPNFQRFKQQLFSNVTTDDSTLIEETFDRIRGGAEENLQEIIEKSEMLKERLVELENEIVLFKKHNMELIKMKQAHELEKVQLEQDQVEMQEKLNDEKIKLEIYLHDERMKIEDEKNKLEKLIRDQRIPNRKERDEILRLKEEVEALQKEIKLKESKHVSAQGRLRAQNRNLEKEVKDIMFEIENLKKENKKLQSENTRLNRQQNNKMLQEINKTIAKLAPKSEKDEDTHRTAVCEVRNRNTKAVVAKVISHKRQSILKQSKLAEDIESSEISLDSSDDESFYKSKQKYSDFKSESKTSLNNKQTDISKSDSSTKKFKREIQNTDGSKDIWYPNGNLKKISADGMQIKMLYFNKDIKETNITEGTVKYYYAETNTWHTTYLDGLQILEFPNGQTEHRFKDGTIEVHFPNGSIRITNPKNEKKSEEWRYADGTQLITFKNGDKILILPNGQKEIHTKLHKRREYPDGTVKIVYPDGSQETRYSNGRVRLKDNDGNLVMDSETI